MPENGLAHAGEFGGSRRAPTMGHVIAGRYSLDREIGRGGTGVVWLGRDEVLHREVALKRIGLLPGADDTDLARAEREAQLSAKLNHPHVVGIFDVVIDDESRAHWLVMEYVEGVTLGQRIKQQGALTPQEVAPILWQAADALAAAHKAGIVHRDVKPSNILLDRNGQAKLTDFGIARIAAEPSLTQTGLMTGSPAYIAPEIISGGRGDEAADVWSLGVTLFHALAGHPPYELGDNLIGALYRVVNEEPPRLANAGWLAPLLEATMIRDPAQRWSMEQVRDFLAGKPRSAPTAPIAPTPAYIAPTPVDAESGTRQIARSPKRAPGRTPSKALLVGLGLLLALLTGGALYAGLKDSDDDPAGPTTTPSETASSPPAAAKPTEDGIKAFIEDYVSAVAEDPATSWPMLTPKFQDESGGFTKYQDFWDDATDGRVLRISANPDNLSVSYQVRFDNFNNGPGPTVLDLTFDDGKYLIDGERSEGFTPAS